MNKQPKQNKPRKSKQRIEPTNIDSTYKHLAPPDPKDFWRAIHAKRTRP